MDEDFADLAGGNGISIHNGFPNPAIERQAAGPRLALDLERLLVRHPSSTYIFRIAGHQWSDQGVFDGDLALIDRAAGPQPSDLVLVWQTSGFALLRQRQLATDATAWGVVTTIIHRLSRY